MSLALMYVVRASVYNSFINLTSPAKLLHCSFPNIHIHNDLLTHSAVAGMANNVLIYFSKFDSI